MVLKVNVTKANWGESMHRRESTIRHSSRRPQTETAGAHQWEKPVVSSRQRGRKGKTHCHTPARQRATACLSSSARTFACPKWSSVCASRFGLYSHQRACENWPSNFPKPSFARNQPLLSLNNCWLLTCIFSNFYHSKSLVWRSCWTLLCVCISGVLLQHPPKVCCFIPCTYHSANPLTETVHLLRRQDFSQAPLPPPLRCLPTSEIFHDGSEPETGSA